MGLLDSLQNQISGSAITDIASKLGVPPDQAQSAVSSALPLLLGALGHNASQPQGAQDLHDAITGDHAGLDAGSVLQQSVSGANSGVGSAILGHLFGSQQPAAAQGLGQSTGLGEAGAQQLLGMLAPVVMAHLGQQVSQNGTNASGLSQMLGQEVQNIALSPEHSGLLSSVFNSAGGLSGIMKLGGSLFGGGNPAS